MSLHLLLISLFAVVLLVPLAQGAPQVERGSGILIEMEDFDEKFSDVKTFASPTREREASGRHVLVRFFEPGHVIYRFTVPADGVYTGWLRYGTKNDVGLRVALDPVGEPEFTKLTVPATGGYIGPGVWGWGRMFRESLSAGAHTLAIGSVSMRPDCIWVSATDEEPTDALIHRERPALDPQTRALVDKPLVDVRPDWLDGATDYRLPAWYEEHRVHAHTRLSLRLVNDEVFFTAARGFKEMGVRVFARHIKSGREGAWWPSALGAVDPRTEGRNIAKQIIDNAHREGLRIIVYHRHMEDEHMAAEHPDWVCVNWKGEPLSSRRGAYMCFNSPYPDYLLQRALELVELGADGFFYDEVHMPKTGCWCRYCRERFTEETGLDHPVDDDPDDPIWHKLRDFNNLTIERTFSNWRRAIHERNPELVMLIGSNTYPSIADRHMTHRLFRIADSMKTEFSLPMRHSGNVIMPFDTSMQPVEKDAKVALGYTLARDATDGRPAHIWAHGLINEASTLYATAGMVTHGCIANLDIRENTIPNMMFKKAYALGDKVSPYFAGTVPLRWAALHYSEHARDKYATRVSDAWRRILYPLYGAYLALLRAHLPVGIVTDSQLEEGLLGGYKVLFVPPQEDVTERMRAAVGDFKANGGLVIEQRESWQWHDPNGGHEKALQAFMAAIGDEAKSAPVEAFGGPEKMHAASFLSRNGKRLTVSLANDFSWVYTGRAVTRDGKQIDLSPYETPPPPCTGVRVFIRGYGGPKRIFDAVSGRELAAQRRADGVEMAVPDFEYMAVLVVEL